ncbi:9103_t:CDS:2, partial [Funneliformis caledonium]
YIVYPLFAFVLIFLDIILRIVTFLGIDTSTKSVGEWNGLTKTKLDDIVRRGTVILGKPFISYVDENNGDGNLFKQIRNLKIDMVETLLLLASILYERREENVNEAIKKIKGFENKAIIQEDILYIRDQLLISEEPIRNQVKKWGIKFTSITELNSLGGPYAGMFWSTKGNFIVVGFKGTTPAYFSEWLADFMIQKIDARAYLYGQVHEGFYTSLFPEDDYAASKLYRRSPSLRLIEAIRGKAAEIKNYNKTINKTDPISLWITGHSLGGGLATLFYTHLLKNPKIVGEDCIIRDGVTFAAPNVGDKDFAAYFSSQSNGSFEPTSTLWRVVAENDIVPHISPSYIHPRLSRFFKSIDVLNYFHIGEEIKFHFDGSLPTSTRPIFETENYFYYEKRSKLTNINLTKVDQIVVDSDKFLYPYEKYIPSFFRNHFTHRYFVSLEKSRHHFEALENYINDNCK